MTSLRFLRLKTDMDLLTEEGMSDASGSWLTPVPSGLLSGGTPLLRNVTMEGTSFGMGARTTLKIPAFAHVTTAALPDIDLLYMHNLGLYFPNLVHLCVGPTFKHDGSWDRKATASATYLQDKKVAVMVNLQTLHIDCSRILPDSYDRLGARARTLAQILYKLAPHLDVISLEGINDTHGEGDPAMLLDELVTAYGLATRISVEVANSVRLGKHGGAEMVHLAINAFRDDKRLVCITASVSCYFEEAVT